MTPEDRVLFDSCFARVLDALPARIRELIDRELVVIVDDQPSVALLDDLARDEGGPRSMPDEILGLHTGVPLTEWSVEDGAREPTTIRLFRLGILREARQADLPGPAEIERQIRITLLHEIGHHFGLDEDDLDRLGYA
ncbi:MAG: metallopeptidase family protein [Planctomycetota bacterium]